MNKNKTYFKIKYKDNENNPKWISPFYISGDGKIYLNEDTEGFNPNSSEEEESEIVQWDNIEWQNDEDNLKPIYDDNGKTISWPAAWKPFKQDENNEIDSLFGKPILKNSGDEVVNILGKEVFNKNSNNGEGKLFGCIPILQLTNNGANSYLLGQQVYKSGKNPANSSLPLIPTYLLGQEIFGIGQDSWQTLFTVPIIYYDKDQSTYPYKYHDRQSDAKILGQNVFYRDNSYSNSIKDKILGQQIISINKEHVQGNTDEDKNKKYHYLRILGAELPENFPLEISIEEDADSNFTLNIIASEKEKTNSSN